MRFLKAQFEKSALLFGSPFALFLLLFSACQSSGEVKNENSVNATFTTEQAKIALDKSVGHYKSMMQSLPDTLLPRTFQNGELVTSDIYWWTSGFYPGTLWYLYEYSKEDVLGAEAIKRTATLEPIKFVTDNHDLGFMLYCSFGNGYRLGKNPRYKGILLQGAESLSSRYRETPQVIRSWDTAGPKGWQYAVIIDNMMNLEFLTWADRAKRANQKVPFEDIAITHANTTIANHFRPDGSSYHVLDYDTLTGKVLQKNTHQGYSDESAWARGQTWGLYGYTMMYRETQEPQFLAQAEKIANFLINHPNLPADKIPYWDFDAPNIPDAYRDSSAGAIMASALLELSTLTKDAELAKKYRGIAEEQLNSLASDTYFAAPGTNGNFILQHGVGHLPGNSEVDVPLTYGDYYFVEALLRYLELEGEFKFAEVVY